MNHRPLLEDKIVEFSKSFPEYKFGEVMFSILTQVCKGKGFSKEILLSLSDQQFYTAISRAFTIESGERDLTEQEIIEFLNR